MTVMENREFDGFNLNLLSTKMKTNFIDLLGQDLYRYKMGLDF